MKINTLLIALPAALALSACSDDSDHDFQGGIDSQAAEVQAAAPSAPLFDPTGRSTYQRKTPITRLTRLWR